MSNYYIYIMSGLMSLTLVILVVTGFLYRKQNRKSQNIIDNLQNEIKTYQSIIAQLQQEGLQSEGDNADFAKSGQASKEKDVDKRIWVKIQGFD